MNQVTSWLDLSQIYNSKKTIFDQVNVNPADRAKLLVVTGDNGKGYMPRCPVNTRPAGSPPISCAACVVSANRNPSFVRSHCFIGGDFRTDENIALASHQTVWVREHNRIVDILRAGGGAGVNASVLFHEARRIVIAEYQHIIYNEFLPPLIGHERMKKFRLKPLRPGRNKRNKAKHYNRQYNPNVDPLIQNVFATAVFRFGHAMLPDAVTLLDDQFNFLPTNLTWDMNNLVFNFPQLNQPGVMTQLFRGLMNTPAGKVGGFFAAAARDILNLDATPRTTNTNRGGFDLLAWNINRGRDHGLAPYHMWLALTNRVKPKSWRDFAKRFQRGRITVNFLKRLYKSWKDMDLYLSGLLEKIPVDNAGKQSRVLGATYATILASQFARLRRGDRFFYEDATGERTRFKPRELAQIKKITLSQILCFNLNNEGKTLRLLPHALLRRRPNRTGRSQPANRLTDCAQILKKAPNYTVFTPRSRQFGRKR